MDGAQGGLAIPGAPWCARQPGSLEEVAPRGCDVLLGAGKSWVWALKWSNSFVTHVDLQPLNISASVVGLLKVVSTS